MESKVTLELCQIMSHEETKPSKSKRVKMILKALDHDMTAREIADKLGYADMNRVRPRLTEMVGAGLIEVTGTKYDKETKRRVSVFKRLI